MVNHIFWKSQWFLLFHIKNAKIKLHMLNAASFFKIKDDFEAIHQSNNQKLPDRRIQDGYHSIVA